MKARRNRDPRVIEFAIEGVKIAELLELILALQSARTFHEKESRNADSASRFCLDPPRGTDAEMQARARELADQAVLHRVNRDAAIRWLNVLEPLINNPKGN